MPIIALLWKVIHLVLHKDEATRNLLVALSRIRSWNWSILSFSVTKFVTLNDLHHSHEVNDESQQVFPCQHSNYLSWIKKKFSLTFEDSYVKEQLLALVQTFAVIDSTCTVLHGQQQLESKSTFYSDNVRNIEQRLMKRIQGCTIWLFMQLLCFSVTIFFGKFSAPMCSKVYCCWSDFDCCRTWTCLGSVTPSRANKNMLLNLFYGSGIIWTEILLDITVQFFFNSLPSDPMWHTHCAAAQDLSWLLTSPQSAWLHHGANAVVSSSAAMTQTHIKTQTAASFKALMKLYGYFCFQGAYDSSLCVC